MHTVIFDLDGTLADTSADLVAAANACFRRHGLDDVLDPVRDAALAFRGGRAMLEEGFRRTGAGGPAEVSAAYPLFLAHYGQNIRHHTELYPGARAAVERLVADGYRVGVCTNKPEAMALTLLDRLGVAEMFASVVGAETLPVRKPDPAPYVAAVERAGGAVARSMLVGDTVTDRDTARAAGVPVALVSFGPEGTAVAALEPDALLPAFADLPEVAQRLIGRPG